MKLFIFLGFLGVLVCLVQAQPLSQHSSTMQQTLAVVDPIPSLHNRQKRATCDLLSGFGVNHSACAVHCIALGKSGGFCNGKAVCVCRR